MFTFFPVKPSLRNIIKGIVAKEDINVHEYELVGRRVVHRMLGHNVLSFNFKRVDKVKILSSSPAVKVAPGKSIDPDLVLQHFLVICKIGRLDLEEVMKYELSAYPASLFVGMKILRMADKP